MGYSHLISVPPCRGYMFLIVIPLRNSKLKTLYLEEFQAQNTLALKNSMLKTLYLEEFQSQNLLPLKNSCSWQISSPKLYILEKFSTQNILPLKNSKLWIWSIQSSKHFTLSLKNLKPPFIPEEFHHNDSRTLKNSTSTLLVPWRIPEILDRGSTDIKWNSPFVDPQSASNVELSDVHIAMPGCMHS